MMTILFLLLFQTIPVDQFPFAELYRAPLLQFTSDCYGTVPLKVLIIGNSITYHPASGEWNNDWGMAASAPEADYVHQVGQAIADSFCADVTLQAMAVWRFEYGLTSVDEFASEKEFQPDLLIIRLGDNPNAGPVEGFIDRVCELVTYLGADKTMITGTFYLTPANALLANAPCGDGFIPLIDLWSDASNHAYSESKNYNPTILDHPGDRGMERIANRIMAWVKHLPLRKTFIPLMAEGEKLYGNTR